MMRQDGENFCGLASDFDWNWNGSKFNYDVEAESPTTYAFRLKSYRLFHYLKADFKSWIAHISIPM